MNEILTKQDKAFVEEYVETGNKTQAVNKAFKNKHKNDNVAGVIGNRMLRKVKIQNAIQSIAERIPDELLEKTHLEGLEAGKRIFKNNNESGEIEDMGVEPDYATRHKYLDTAYKLKGSYAPDKNININMNVKSIDATNPKVLELIDELRKANESQ